jgi:hypothetical protein
LTNRTNKSGFLLYFTFFEKGFSVVYVKNATEKMRRKSDQIGLPFLIFLASNKPTGSLFTKGI